MRARPAETVSGVIDLQHEEGNSLLSRSLQHSQPVGDLLEGTGKTRAQDIHVVVHAHRRFLERGVRHDERMCGIAGKLKTGDAPRLVGRQVQGLDLRH